MHAVARRTLEPAAEPVLLQEALLHLRETGDGGANDAYIEGLIVVARQACEERLQRTLITSTWRLTMDAFPEEIQLLRPPIISVQSVQYVDVDGATQTLDTAEYRVDLADAPGRITPAYGLRWPVARDVIGAVQVNYTAGYGAAGSAVPRAIRQWLLLAVGDMYSHRNLSSDKPVVQHNFADALLDPYRVWG